MEVEVGAVGDAVFATFLAVIVNVRAAVRLGTGGIADAVEDIDQFIDKAFEFIANARKARFHNGIDSMAHSVGECHLHLRTIEGNFHVIAVEVELVVELASPVVEGQRIIVDRDIVFPLRVDLLLVVRDLDIAFLVVNPYEMGFAGGLDVGYAVARNVLANGFCLCPAAKACSHQKGEADE